MARHRQIFTPTVLEAIKGLAAQGKSAAEIAAVVGSTPASVRVRCSQFKIKLARPHFGSRRNKLQPVSKRKLVVYLPPSVYAAMTRKAQDMRKSTVELAESLLRAIVNSNLYEAVLDEAE
jgi:hypothetical protein